MYLHGDRRSLYIAEVFCEHKRVLKATFFANLLLHTKDVKSVSVLSVRY